MGCLTFLKRIVVFLSMEEQGISYFESQRNQMTCLVASLSLLLALRCHCLCSNFLAEAPLEDCYVFLSFCEVLPTQQIWFMNVIMTEQQIIVTKKCLDNKSAIRFSQIQYFIEIKSISKMGAFVKYCEVKQDQQDGNDYQMREMYQNKIKEQEQTLRIAESKFTKNGQDLSRSESKLNEKGQGLRRAQNMIHEQEEDKVRQTSLINRLKQQIDIGNKELEKIKSENTILQSRAADLRREIDRLKKELMGRGSQINRQQSESEGGQLVHRSAAFFMGYALYDFDDYKAYLTEIIENEFKKTIMWTPPLYRYDKKFPRNLPQAIKGAAPFVLIVKTQGFHFAAISEGPYIRNSQGRGWLISLSKKRVFRLISGKPAVQYDGTYLIFGNQEVRIEGQSDRVFSNFGINNSYYNTTGLDVKDFIGPGIGNTPREALIDCFEVYGLEFK